MNISLVNISAGYNGCPVLRNISATLQSGEVICLLGPNGSGKTTLFRSILGLLPSTGKILFDGEEFGTADRRKRSRMLAYVPQAHTPPFPFTGLEVVLSGRTPHIGPFSTPSDIDYRIAMGALETVGAGHHAGRAYTELSGGERQLVLIARALAQQSRFLIMDEPTSHLDYGNQLKITQTVRTLAQTGMGIILTTHTPDQAFLCATRVIALCRGAIIAQGPPAGALTKPVLKAMYGVTIDVVALEDGRRVCTPATAQEAVA
jgi:iron complex transport system ATP-binding protein